MTRLALVLICCVSPALLVPAQAQNANIIRWQLNADGNGDGVADGWTTRTESGKVTFRLADGVQQVVGALAGDGLERTAEPLDADAAYLVTARVTVTRGGLLWGAEGFARRYVAPYSRPVDSRTTCRGIAALKLVFLGVEGGSDFTVDTLRIEKIDKRPLPVEADTGRFLIPRPRTVRYAPGEQAHCLLQADTPVAPVGLAAEDVSLDLLRGDLGFTGAVKLVAPETLQAGPALVVGLPAALQKAKLPGRLAAAGRACPPTLAPEAYYLAVVPEGVVVAGGSAAGAQYGLQTLRQLCARAGEGLWRVPKLTIEDAPAAPFRGAYQGGVTASPDRLARARYYARLKLNAVVMEDPLLYHLTEGDNLQRARDYFSTLRRLHLEPIPLVQSFGWGMYLLAIDPQCVEACEVRERPMRFATRQQVDPAVRDSVPDDGREYLVPVDALAPLPAAVRNPSFEAGAAGEAQDWQADRWAEGDGATVAAAPAGGRCLRLSRRTRGTVRVWQDLDLPTNRAVRLTVNLKLQGVDGGGAYAELYRLDDRHELVGGPVVMGRWLKGSADWAPMNLDLDAGTSPHYRLYLRIQDATGTAWFDEVRLTPAGAELRNLVRSEESLQLTDAAGTALVAGQDYELVPGETNFPFTADAKPWRFVRLPNSRVRAGGDVRLSYEYAPAGAVTYCPSNPRTQAIMRETLGTVIRELGVSAVHIGHDEPRWLNTCRRCRERHLSNARLFADELIRMRDFCRAANPQVRVMMWADALNPFHNAPLQRLEPANDTAPKDLIQCTWFYDARDDVAEARSLEYFAARGYETTGSPWYNLENSWDWAQECARSREATGKCLGVLYTSWADNPDEDAWAGLPVTATFAWSPDDPPALEMLPWSPAEMNRTWGVLP